MRRDVQFGAVFLLGACWGIACLVVPVLTSHRLAAVVSQGLYDCGIRVAEDVTQYRISNAVILHHRYAVCTSVNGHEVILSMPPYPRLPAPDRTKDAGVSPAAG